MYSVKRICDICGVEEYLDPILLEKDSSRLYNDGLLHLPRNYECHSCIENKKIVAGCGGSAALVIRWIKQNPGVKKCKKTSKDNLLSGKYVYSLKRGYTRHQCLYHLLLIERTILELTKDQIVVEQSFTWRDVL